MLFSISLWYRLGTLKYNTICLLLTAFCLHGFVYYKYIFILLISNMFILLIKSHFMLSILSFISFKDTTSMPSFIDQPLSKGETTRVCFGSISRYA